MRSAGTLSGLAVLVLAMSATAQDEPADEAARIGPHAERILKSMSAYLQTANEFSFRADVIYDSLLGDDQKVQYGGVAKVTVRRPDRLHVEYSGDELPRQIVIDGKSFFVLHREANVYATAAVPADLDAAMDSVFERFGYSVPIADFVYSDAHAVLTESVDSGTLVGRHAVGATPCHHLAFTQESIDWQIWVEDGPNPLPRRLVITYRDEPGSPQYSATLSDWDFEPRVADGYFEFDPPEGAEPIEFLPAAEEPAVEEPAFEEEVQK